MKRFSGPSGSQVLRLEARTRALGEGAVAAADAGKASKGNTATVDGLARARVALALKSASSRRQRDIVKALRSEVEHRGPSYVPCQSSFLRGRHDPKTASSFSVFLNNFVHPVADHRK